MGLSIELCTHVHCMWNWARDPCQELCAIELCFWNKSTVSHVVSGQRLPKIVRRCLFGHTTLMSHAWR